MTTSSIPTASTMGIEGVPIPATTPREIEAFLDLPERLFDLLFRFLHQNKGRLSRRARSQEFAALSDDEAHRIEQIYAEAFTD